MTVIAAAAAAFFVLRDNEDAPDLEATDTTTVTDDTGGTTSAAPASTTAATTTTAADPEPESGSPEAIAAALQTGDGVYVEPGAAISATAAAELVGRLRGYGEVISYVVLADERQDSATTIADEIYNALGEGIVLVVAPETIGLSGTATLFTATELQAAVEGSLGAASDEAALASFTNALLVIVERPETTTTAAPVIEVLSSAEITVLATSVLPASGSSTYGPENMLDGILETAWNHCGTGCDETGAARQGVGQTLTFLFGREVELVGLRVANGYQKISDSVGDVWVKNNRIESFVAETAAGSEVVVLRDERGYQELALGPVLTDFLILEVGSVYTGDGTYNDLAVSEIEVLVAVRGA